jgi:GNAT superfamily N-acetyltransferase
MKSQNNSLEFAIEDNFNDLFAALAEKCDLPHSFSEKVNWVNSSPFCWPNFIFGARFTRATLDRDLEEAVGGIKRRIAPPYWLVGPRNGVAELGDRLQEHGLRLVDSWPGMALDLDRIEAQTCENPSLQIKIAADQNDLADWHVLVSRELFPKKKLDFDMFFKVLQEPAFKYFIAYHNGAPVSTAMAFYSSGAVGLYMIATSAGQRGRGFGTAVTAAALRHARAEGQRIAILQSTQMGLSVYQKLGFKEHCSFDVFWMLGDEFK